MNLKDTLSDILTREVIQDEDIFLVELIVADKGKLRVTVIMDGDKGISIDRCAVISRRLGAIIEERNLIEDAYQLEVSSPGLDHPLMLNRQYISNIGRKIKVELNDGTVKTGKLETVTDDKISIAIEPEKGKGRKKPQPEEQSVEEIPFSDIKKTNVLVSF